MFTGLIRATGTIKALRPGSNSGYKIAIIPDCQLADLQLDVGASIALDGVCLTVVELTDRGFLADLSSETVERTTFSLKRPGSLVNIEPAVRVDQALGGHLVTGHVDEIAQILQIDRLDNSYRFTVGFSDRVAPMLAPKGSVTIDGISLTVNRVKTAHFTVRVIPHTYRVTNLHSRQPGDKVNLEVDTVARYLYNFWLKARRGNLDIQQLKESFQW